MSYRFHCAAVLAVLLFSFSFEGASGQTGYVYNPACMIPGDSCSEWQVVTTIVNLPEYPGCELILTYEKRECPDPPSPHPIEEVIIREIYWPTLTNPLDSTRPCYNVNTAYQNTLANQKKDFLNQLFQDVVQVKFRERFEQRYEQDSVAAVIFPNTPEIVDKYTFLLCGYGKKTYRVINGLCMAAVTKPNVQFTGVFSRAEEDEEKGASVADGPPHSATNYMRVRYIPCDPSSEPICCIQQLRYCRNPFTWKTELEQTGTIMGQATACSLSVLSPLYLQPGETSTGCRDYCLDYQPGTWQEGNGGGPNLSGPVGRAGALRAEEIRYEGPKTVNR